MAIPKNDSTQTGDLEQIKEKFIVALEKASIGVNQCSQELIAVVKAKVEVQQQLQSLFDKGYTKPSQIKQANEEGVSNTMKGPGK